MTWTWHDISFEFIWRFGRWNYMTFHWKCVTLLREKTGRCALDICLPGMLHGCRYWTMNIPIQVWVTQFGPDFSSNKFCSPAWSWQGLPSGHAPDENWSHHARPWRFGDVLPTLPEKTGAGNLQLDRGPPFFVGCQAPKELKKHQDMMIELAVRMYPCLRVFNIGCFDDSCLFCFSIPVIVYWQFTGIYVFEIVWKEQP